MNMKKVILAFILGLSLSTISVVALSLCNAKDIEYKSSDTNWDVETVEDALNELYSEDNCKLSNEFYEYLKQPFFFAYIGSSQRFSVPVSGNYKIELWGASGGGSKNLYSYTSGIIYLNSRFTLYIYVGGKGADTNGSGIGGYNGGGNTNHYSGYCGPSGGGATDVRLVGGEWDNFDSLKSRIMVAAGGGGGNDNDETYDYYGNSGNAGGLYGYDGTLKTYEYYADVGKGGTQTSGGAQASQYPGSTSVSTAGGFGIGGIGGSNRRDTQNGGGCGGGGGYYGGSGGSGIVMGIMPSGGGSSFISGHDGCDAILEASTASSIKHSGQSEHYSHLVFKDTVMIDAAGYQWTSERGEMVGAKIPEIETNGNGLAKITYLGS